MFAGQSWPEFYREVWKEKRGGLCPAVRHLTCYEKKKTTDNKYIVPNHKIIKIKKKMCWCEVCLLYVLEIMEGFGLPNEVYQCMYYACMYIQHSS